MIAMPNNTSLCRFLRNLANEIDEPTGHKAALLEAADELERFDRLAPHLPSRSTPAIPPLLTAYSRAELTNKLKAWMIEQWGIPKELDDDARDRWFLYNGLIFSFIFDHFPEDPT
jgi:hypothetical protein